MSHRAAGPSATPQVSLPYGAVPRCLPERGVGRSVRVGLFAGLSLALAVIAHRLGGETVPSDALWPAAGGSLVVGWWISRRQQTGRVIGAVTIATQTVLHAAFMAGMHAGAGDMSATAAPGRPPLAVLRRMFFCHHAGHRPSAAVVRAATRGIAFPMTRTPPADLARHAALAAAPMTAAPMIAAHLAAAAALAWWLARGERRFWAATRRVVAVLTAPVRSTPATGAPRPSRFPGDRPTLVGTLAPLTFRRRGPPTRAVPVLAA